MDYTNLLKSKGFDLNEYPEGKFWEYAVKDNELLKEKICKIFQAIIDISSDGTDINTLILQCAEDFSHCLFYYDCNSFDMEIDEFMECIEKM